MKEIAGWLDLPGLQRVEAFDISNINGFETVGSMVVYEKENQSAAITESSSSALSPAG